MSAIRVMIVEDSPTVRASIARAVADNPCLMLVAECESAEEALTRLEPASPDVISMDIHLPGMSGLQATRRIMERRPTPIVIVSRSVNPRDIEITMEALRAGAVSAVEKPTRRSRADAGDPMSRLCRELAVMSQVKVIRQRFNRSSTKFRRLAGPGAPADARDGHQFQSAALRTTRGPRRASAAAPPATAVGIVASTGGPRALECVLEAMGPDYPLPIFLVQHITASFQRGFVAWLDSVAPQPVREAMHGESPLPGRVYVAPSAIHLTVRLGRIVLESGAPRSGHCPSGTLLLRSLAESYGPRAVGVVLTGMGDDGAEGLLAIRRAGGYTITEHESTVVVNGMPKAARAIGASCASLPLEAIGEALRDLAPLAQEIGA